MRALRMKWAEEKRIALTIIASTVGVCESVLHVYLAGITNSSRVFCRMLLLIKYVGKNDIILCSCFYLFEATHVLFLFLFF